jgi:hypothetical protein
MPRTPDIPMAEDGWTVWVQPKTEEDGEQRFRPVCCDCNLAHDAEFRVVYEPGLMTDVPKVEFRVKRNERATAQLRRRPAVTGARGGQDGIPEADAPDRAADS